jgi:BsuBI/PstI restriction endonuclease domain/BsuBI/PstI restriction endonuclease HTH domain
MNSSAEAGALPALPALTAIQDRLATIFPSTFADRGLLVGTMAARVVFVFLYGGFVEGSARFLRPSHVYLFTHEQTRRTSDEQRRQWLAHSLKTGYRPVGRRWYADNSRESIRDDLMRNQLLRIGIIGKRSDVAVPTTSSKPIYFMYRAFADMFAPRLSGLELARAIDAWRAQHLDPGTLQRMALRAQGALRTHGDVLIDMPDSTRMRVAAGPSSDIAKALIERFAPAALRKPAVLWLSASDRKSYPQFVALAATIGFTFDLNAELPDLILADLADPLRIVFCEVVASDGAMTEARRSSLLRLVAASNVPPAAVHFLTAFQDREAAAFRRNFSRLAIDSEIWFCTEPDLIVRLMPLQPG